MDETIFVRGGEQIPGGVYGNILKPFGLGRGVCKSTKAILIG
jgi:hypothetical protein